MNRSKNLLRLFEEANQHSPLFLGHPQTGEPVQLSKEAFEHIKDLLRDDIYQSLPTED